MVCDHLDTNAQAAVYRIDNPGDADRPFFAACLRVTCNKCGVMFRFLGKHGAMPDSLLSAARDNLGSWLSPLSDEVGFLISPMDSGSVLEGLIPEGRA